MRLTTKGRFAVTAMIDLGLRSTNGPVALAAISQRQQISLSYLEQLFGKLRRHELVESTRGPGGGYTLGREAALVSVADIVSAVDDPADALAEGGDGLSQALWQRLNEAVLAHMATITLQSLVDEQKAAGAAVETRPARRAAASASAPAPALRPPRTTAPNSVFAFGRSFAR